MKQKDITELRAFNRFYTSIIGVLDKHLLNSDYSLIEARILFEMAHKESMKASDIVALVNIDKGYLSRILKKFEKNGLIIRVGSVTDKRAVSLQLSEKGKKEFKILNEASDKQIASLFAHLTTAESEELVQKVRDLQTLLKKTAHNEEHK